MIVMNSANVKVKLIAIINNAANEKRTIVEFEFLYAKTITAEIERAKMTNQNGIELVMWSFIPSFLSLFWLCRCA